APVLRECRGGDARLPVPAHVPHAHPLPGVGHHAEPRAHIRRGRRRHGAGARRDPRPAAE
ncbi:hypothetical protein HPB47_026613, partial [Ixodes persulcatus]